MQNLGRFTAEVVVLTQRLTLTAVCSNLFRQHHERALTSPMSVALEIDGERARNEDALENMSILPVVDRGIPGEAEQPL